MKVKIFDCEHEQDLELMVNEFLQNEYKIIDIKYQTSHFNSNGEQIYSFSCMVIYVEKCQG